MKEVKEYVCIDFHVMQWVLSKVQASLGIDMQKGDSPACHVS